MVTFAGVQPGYAPGLGIVTIVTAVSAVTVTTVTVTTVTTVTTVITGTGTDLFDSWVFP